MRQVISTLSFCLSVCLSKESASHFFRFPLVKQCHRSGQQQLLEEVEEEGRFWLPEAASSTTSSDPLALPPPPVLLWVLGLPWASKDREEEGPAACWDNISTHNKHNMHIQNIVIYIHIRYRIKYNDQTNNSTYVCCDNISACNIKRNKTQINHSSLYSELPSGNVWYETSAAVLYTRLYCSIKYYTKVYYAYFVRCVWIQRLVLGCSWLRCWSGWLPQIPHTYSRI